MRARCSDLVVRHDPHHAKAPFRQLFFVAGKTKLCTWDDMVKWVQMDAIGRSRGPERPGVSNVYSASSLAENLALAFEVRAGVCPPALQGFVNWPPTGCAYAP